MTLEALQPQNIGRHGQAPHGARPELLWLDIACLRIDVAYQRAVGKAGRKSIDRIAAEFSWAKFAPLIVSPAPGGLYAIVDGQHRATAAAERGILKVPAWVVKLSPAEQASAFTSINGQVTPITALALFKSARAAGEPWAVELGRVCDAEGVTILPYPRQQRDLKAGDTMAVSSLRHLLARHGERPLRLALGVIRAVSNEPGSVVAVAVKAFTEAFAQNAHWLHLERSRVVGAARGLSLSLCRQMGTKAFGAHVQQRLLTTLPKVGQDADGGSDAEILRLHERRVSLTAIAAKTRRPYADIQAVIDRARTVQEAGSAGRATGTDKA